MPDITKPTGEQIRFVSSKTGDHVLDTYMELVERGNRTLYELLDDIFDPTTGDLYDNFIQFRVNATTKEIEIRAGQFIDPNLGWIGTGTTLLKHRGAHTAGTTYNQFDLVTYNNGTYICYVQHVATATLDLAKFGLIVDANYIATYASNALASQNAAALSETNAATSAASALSSKNTALAAEANVVSLYDQFDDRYLGSKAADPTTDNDGNALQIGALYFNTVGNVMRVYDGSLWQNVAPPAQLVVAYDQLFSGNGVTTTFTLSNAPYSAKCCDISISGVKQRNGIDFTLIGTTLTFTSAPPTGTNNIYVQWTTPTGSVDKVTFSIIDNTALATQAEAEAGTANDKLMTALRVAQAIASLAPKAFPAGTVMLFKQTAAPTGWTKSTDAALNDSAIRIVTGAVGSGGSNAFSAVNSQTSVGATTLSESQMPSHVHSGALKQMSSSGQYASGSPNRVNNIDTGATGGGQSHTHTITMNMKYNDVIVATKD